MTTFESIPNGPSYQELGEYFPEPAAKRQRIDHGHYQISTIDNGNLLVPSGERSQFHPIPNLDARDIPDDIWSGFLDDSNQTSAAWLNGTSHFSGNFETEENSRVLTYDQSIESALQGSLMDDAAFHDWQPQPPQVSAVEPSAGQVSFVETTMPEEIVEKDVCFGMISDIPISTAQSSLLTFDSSDIPLSFSPPNQLTQIFGHCLIFGETDERTAKILEKLASDEEIKFQISCRTINRRAAPGKKGRRKVGVNELQYVMNTIIYGPAELGDAVGQFLAKCGIFLQDPLNCDRDVVYVNPHILSRTEEIVTTLSLVSFNDTPEIEKLISQEDLFSELSSDSHLALTDAPDAIETPLYVHQKRALTFMLKREEGWQYDGSLDDMWAKEIDETGQMTYTNMVTEMAQKTQPPDSRGGLLADQMGLGKSLTMISLIALNTCKANEPILFTSSGTLRRLKSTLVVVPYSLLETWNNQLKRHLCPDTLTWMRFHGSQKRKVLTLGIFDIVITTFETLVRQQKKHLDPKCAEDTLFSFSWHRIILDEGKYSPLLYECVSNSILAHTIRNRATAMAGACCAIHATNRWAVTGTPIQNRVTDFSSLLEYLRIYPFENPKVFDTEITKPWLKSGDRDISRLKRLVNCISLCRTKAIIDLPKREDLIHYLEFSEEEQEFYNKAKEGTIRKIDDALKSNPLQPGQYLNALQWLNELRLLCNHGLAHAKRTPNKSLSITPQETQTWTKSTANKAFETIVCAGEAMCSVCGNLLTDGIGGASNSDFRKPFLSKCLTLTCGSCVKDAPSHQPVPTCPCTPLCKSIEVSWAHELVPALSNPKPLPTIPTEHVSTKLKILLKDLKTCPEGEKSVVFSYWTFTLDLIESLLQQETISYTRIDGQHSGERREEAIQKFQTDESIQVILVSITCGGAGLDLTAASVAYLLEPQWNPMMEEQALCRIHRLGQHKDVKTIRYRIKGSFEEKVVATQELKKQIAAEAFSSESRRNPSNNIKRLQHLREQLG